MAGNAAQDEQVREDINHRRRVELAINADCQTLTRELVDDVRHAVFARGPIDPHASNRDVVEQHLARTTIGKSAIEIDLTPTGDAPTLQNKSDTIRIPFAPPASPRKGVAHEPTAPKALDDMNRTALLTAIARAKSWTETIGKDLSQNFKTIVQREQLAERHVRFLAPLAYLSPRIVESIANSEVPVDLTVSSLARNLPMAWSGQEQAVGMS